MTKHPNAQLVEKFYTAFNNRDATTMNSCYAENVTFTDPAFPGLDGRQTRAMWEMLCKNAKNFSLTYRIEEVSDSHAKVHWEAMYDFSKTGRRVHNIITAQMRIENGKIVSHRDTFDFQRWSRMALGPVGLLLGWTPFLQKKVQGEAAKNLNAFMAKKH